MTNLFKGFSKNFFFCSIGIALNFAAPFSIFDGVAQVPREKKEPLTRILFIYDASNSMNAQWQSGNRHEIAKKLFTEALDSLKNADNLELALRVYGHQKYYKQGQDCDDTKLEVPFGKKNTGQLKAKLKDISPKGTTPIAQTLEKAAGDFPPCSDCRNIIILITDGIEECNGDPCAVSQALQKKRNCSKTFCNRYWPGHGIQKNF